MKKENFKAQQEDRKRRYYSLSSDIDSIKWKLKDLEKNRGYSSAFKLLMIALDIFDEQVRRDYDRYERRVRIYDEKTEMAQLQTSLNRERILRENLESKIKEATTSSGLFIKYVREKLNF